MANTYDLERFVTAQAQDYDGALSEIRAGRKQGHWIWYILPQLKGLGRSWMCDIYGIVDLEEARQYLAHPVLGPRLREITEALLALDTCDPLAVMPRPDDMKLQSCMTLFMRADGTPDSPFERALQKYYGGRADMKTLKMLGE